MKGVILDKNSFDRGDIDLTPLTTLDVEWACYSSTPENQIKHRIDGQDIIITNKVRLDKKAISNNSNLKLILIAATGTDNVDLQTCRDRGIIVCNVTHYSTPAVVQHCISLMLNLMTSQPKYINDVTQGKWQKSDVFCLLDHPIVESAGKTLGIIGYGTLGKEVARVAQALGMSIIISRRPGLTRFLQPDSVSFDELLKNSDVISLHCPLTDETRNLFSDLAFKKMKSTAFIINTARGAIIDSRALINALQSGEIAGAAIDVLDKEPPPEKHPLLKQNIENLIVTPHNAWGTRESRQRLINAMAENLKAWQCSQPVNVVS